VSGLKEIGESLAAYLSQVEHKQIERDAKAAEAIPANPALASDLARAVFGYVVSEAAETDTPETLGEALMVGAGAAAKDAGLDQTVTEEALFAFLESVLSAARSVVTEGIPPTIAKVQKLEREIAALKKALGDVGPEEVDALKDINSEMDDLAAKLETAKKNAERAAKARVRDRARDSALRGLGMKKTPYGWE
jgi:hypothetical protein